MIVDAHWLSDVVAAFVVGSLWLNLVVLVALRTRRGGATRPGLAAGLALWAVLGLGCSLDRSRVGAALPALRCPAGTEPASGATPSGREQWCRRASSGVRHGPYVAWHGNGRKQAEGTLADGREQDVWRRWWANGRLLGEGAYEAGVKQGRWRFWHSNGAPQEAGEFRDGRERGRWTRWYENGGKLSEGGYRDGRPEGAWTVWYESGRIREAGEYRDGARLGPWRRWSVNGQVCDVEPAAAPSAPTTRATMVDARSARP
jgi:antitoxin component YwqK of YwqJK toxin-antitoxin module